MNKLILLIIFLIVLLLISLSTNIYLLFFKNNDFKHNKYKTIIMEEKNIFNETNESKESKSIYEYIDEFKEYVNENIVVEYNYYDEEGYKKERSVFEKNIGSDVLTKEEIMLKHNISDDDNLYITFFTNRDINENLRITILVDDILLHQNLKIKKGASLLKYKLNIPITKIKFIVMYDDIPKYTQIFRTDYKGVLYRSDTITPFNTMNKDFYTPNGFIDSGNDYYIDLI